MCSDLALPQKTEMSIDDQRFLSHVTRSIQLNDDQHYEIALLLRYPSLRMPSNRSFVEKRLMYLKRKFAKNPSFYNDYVQFVDKMLSSGYAEKAGKPQHDDQTWYLPHHGVYHPAKPGKIRVVFDCSARFQGISLNDNLLQGPDFTNTLLGVLCRFRLESVGIMGDIQAMFHQVVIPEEDRDLLRFLWWENGDLDQEPKEYRMKVYVFGAACSPSCANFALRKTAENNMSLFAPNVCETVLNNFYVDDCLVSTPSEFHAIALIDNLTNLLKKGGFHMTKWVSNSSNVMQTIPESDRAPVECDSLQLPSQGSAIRALGLLWSIKEDVLQFKTEYKQSVSNRRCILSITNSIYDPLGFLSPFMQPIKVLQQDLCRPKLSWDDPIDEQSQNRVDEWLSDLPRLAAFKVPRCLKPTNFGNVSTIELHHFSDASEQAYGCVSYLRLIDKDFNCHCSIVLAKCRLTPIQRVTVPRLELNAATLSIKHDQVLRQELRLNQVASYFWTDSIIVLRYIRNESRAFKTFVANRVALIRSNSDVSQWRFVTGSVNPADMITRGVTASELLKCSIWLRGPQFLTNSMPWPKQPDFLESKLDSDLEIRSVTVCLVKTPADITVDHLFSSFSSWNKLKITVGGCCATATIYKGTERSVSSTNPLNPYRLKNCKKPNSKS